VLKSDKWGWVLTKGTELGASRFAPVLAQRSISVVEGDRAATKTERWQGLVTAAAKQCERWTIPRVDRPRPLADALRDLGPKGSSEERLLFLERSAAAAREPARRPERLFLAVGPEGGWSEEEQELFLRAGFRLASLGPRILRAETAATAALSVVLGALGELGHVGLTADGGRA
jgi:16S rRNA (uracil1498-N3)-methyltransferase